MVADRLAAWPRSSVGDGAVIMHARRGCRDRASGAASPARPCIWCTQRPIKMADRHRDVREKHVSGTTGGPNPPEGRSCGTQCARSVGGGARRAVNALGRAPDARPPEARAREPSCATMCAIYPHSEPHGHGPRSDEHHAAGGDARPRRRGRRSARPQPIHRRRRHQAGPPRPRPGSIPQVRGRAEGLHDLGAHGRGGRRVLPPIARRVGSAMDLGGPRCATCWTRVC